MRTRCKICGVKDLVSANWAAEAGADAVGLNFVPGSPRQLSIREAAPIAAEMPALVSRVGLFMNAAAEEVRALLGQVHLDLLQFHGEETEDYCRSFDLPYIKALHIGPESDVQSLMMQHPAAQLLLFDTLHSSGQGGTGKQFDWQLLAKAECPRPFMLAGGLRPGNVAAAIDLLAPFAVDVSSGVESERGVKSRAKIEAFIQQVQLADRKKHG